MEFVGLRGDELIDVAQTAALLAVATVLIIAFTAFRTEFKQARESVAKVREAFRAQSDLEEAIERIWKRIDEIETLQGMRIDFEELTRFKRLIDALEAASKGVRPKAADDPSEVDASGPSP